MTSKTVVFRSVMLKVFIAGIALIFVAGCSSLLPTAKQETQTPWRSYADAQAAFDKVIAGKTTVAELKAMSIDPDVTPNVAYLSHTDLLRRLFPIFSYDINLIDPGLKACVSSKETCYAYEVDQLTLDRKRYGNFWLDFFNFRRQIDISGWRFNAVFVIKDDTVVYKLWNGKPNVHQREEERSPLGPFQGFGPTLLTR